jgi:putative ABC transport system permease protein
MTEHRPRNGPQDRMMFWRIVRRLLGAHRGRLLMILLALGAGAAVTAALLNLQVDANRRLTTEFRTFGANVVIAPKSDNSKGAVAGTLPESTYASVPITTPTAGGGKTALLVLVAQVRSKVGATQAVIIGVRTAGNPGSDDAGVRDFDDAFQSSPTARNNCSIGSSVATALRVTVGDELSLGQNGGQLECEVTKVEAPGGEYDSDVLVALSAAQQLSGLSGRISSVRVSYPGTPAQVSTYITALAQQLPDADVHGLRQFTEAEGKIYDRISGLLTATVAIVLILTGLCVMAAMTNVAMERRNDVGLMKAIGGASRRVLRLFVAEADIVGLIGGILGAAVGLALSIWLGKAVFGVAAHPRLIVYPVSVLLTIIVAIAGAYPLRRLAGIRPASVFRGEA